MTSPHLARGAEHLCRLGPRAVAEFLAEVGAATGTEAAIAEHLARWRRLDPHMLRAVLDSTTGGQQFPRRLVVVERAA